MCGICGIATARGAVDRERLAAMSATLRHRGPDADGTYLDDGIGLAARRLSIIDLTGGDQPIANEDGTIVVIQNGELYNYRELRGQLERAGHRFRTHSDTEVLVHAYEEWGLGFAERLRGMFAVALWDARARRLVLARDRFGIKPLYFRDGGGELAFASELDALPRGEIDPDAVDAFLAFNSIPAPLSIFKEIRKLPAGHLLTWQDGVVAIERFARPGPLEVRHDADEAELVEECRARLRDSVRAHLVADVPVGVLLSGGVDSGALAALAAEESSEPVRTFSIGFAEASFDELGGARAVARALRNPPPGARPAPRRRTAPAGPRAGLRRAVRRLVGPADVPRLEARRRGCQGRPLGRRRRRALRGLLHLRRRPARNAGRRPRPAPRAPSSSGCRHRPRGELRPEGQALRPGGAPAAARAPSRLEGDPRAGAPGRADGPRAHGRPARRPPGALCRDRGPRAADPPAGRRLRHLPRRRPAREDRPRVDGLVARGTRPVPGHGRLELRLLSAGAAQGPRPVEEATAAAGGRAAAAALGRARAQARLLDSRGGLAARGAAAVRAARRSPPRRSTGRGCCKPAAATRLLDEHAAGREDNSRQLWGLLSLTLWYEHHVEGIRRDAPLERIVA